MIYETLFIGLIVAVLYVEIMDIYPGGIIVPAYMALFLDQPLRILVTILVAILSLMTYKLLSRAFILFGRRRFVMLILLGALWGQIWFLFLPHIYSGSLEFRAIGWVIPGLLANNLEKQRFLATLASLFTVSIATYFLVRILTRLIL
ncbi:MAG: poly-gamma-glutamate biosynthesis protein PgsC [Candidatus Aminicenantes bacterium]|nr:poly-gamma-glutamate biosynthesis protein PgsC [Candidatus Aminicenantes bacterium]MDH5384202.1 poly-gamma-glutamate biosynthesis protein PgsC [Candidatus Aminicenantes bacterium]MDH5744671.1 poly-gamma-glutamate biosynthesis protein PgsC [Candidatus Aminicenantes bacterium]